jgi:peptidoglycan/LPS O-acetylase OafA/YrhL
MPNQTALLASQYRPNRGSQDDSGEIIASFRVQSESSAQEMRGIMEQIHTRSQRFAGLDLLRFYAAICVVIWHMGERPLGFLNGWDAVTLFFVLSGFLITYLLLAERERTGKTDLPAFYIRRTLRIYPLYAFVVLLGATFLPLSSLQIGPLLVPFIANVIALPDGLGPLWSIGAEEQFYLVYPLLFRRFSVVKIAMTVIVVRQLLLLITGDYGYPVATSYNFLGYQRFDAMAIGALGAWALFHEHTTIRIMQRFWWVFPLLLLLYTIPYMPTLIPERDLLFAIVCLGLIVNIIRLHRLDSAPMRLLGNMSYAIYMLHAMVLIYPQLRGLIPSIPGVAWQLSTLVVILALAFLSYQFLEKPFLHLKDRFARVKYITPVEPVSISRSSGSSIELVES